MTTEPTPPRPETDSEWGVFWAFYRLTVVQRDAAWREVEELRKWIRRVATDMSEPSP